MTALPYAAVDDDTADLLSLVADVESPIGADAPALFLAACRQDAADHDGLVSVNRVRVLLTDADIEPPRYSSLWSAFTGEGKPMRRTDDYEVCSLGVSRNSNKHFPLRRWTGTP